MAQEYSFGGFTFGRGLSHEQLVELVPDFANLQGPTDPVEDLQKSNKFISTTAEDVLYPDGSFEVVPMHKLLQQLFQVRFVADIDFLPPPTSSVHARQPQGPQGPTGMFDTAHQLFVMNPDAEHQALYQQPVTPVAPRYLTPAPAA